MKSLLSPLSQRCKIRRLHNSSYEKRATGLGSNCFDEMVSERIILAYILTCYGFLPFAESKIESKAELNATAYDAQ